MCFFVMNMSLLPIKETVPYSSGGLSSRLRAIALALRGAPLQRLPIHLKRSALHDFQNNGREAVIVLRCLAHHRSYHRHVAVLYSASQRVGEQLFRDGAHELGRITQQALPQADHAIDLAAIDKLA